MCKAFVEKTEKTHSMLKNVLRQQRQLHTEDNRATIIKFPSIYVCVFHIARIYLILIIVWGFKNDAVRVYIIV